MPEVGTASSISIDLICSFKSRDGISASPYDDPHGKLFHPYSFPPPEPDQLEDEFRTIAEKAGALVSREAFRQRLLVDEDQRRASTKAYVFDGSALVNEVVMTMATFTTSATAVAILKISKDVLVQWLKNQRDRSIRLRAGGVHIHITGSNDAEKARAALEKAIATFEDLPKIDSAPNAVRSGKTARPKRTRPKRDVKSG